MDSDKLTELRNYYETTDQSVALETAELDTTTKDDRLTETR